MVKVFLDANVYFAASLSPAGGSGFILSLAQKQKFKIIVSTEVLKEAERNIRKKLSLKELLRFYNNLAMMLKQEVKVNELEAQKYQDIINIKDSWVLAAALQSKSDFLITLDKRHFFTSQIKKAQLPIIILRPQSFLQGYVKILKCT